MIEGLLAGEVEAGSRNFPELLGPGDLLRPWTYRPEFASSLAAPAKWDVLAARPSRSWTREATLRLAAWPEITGVLLDRTVERSRSLAVQFAIAPGGQDERSACGSRCGTSPTAGAMAAGTRVISQPRAAEPARDRPDGGHHPGVRRSCAMESLQERGLVESPWRLGGLRPVPGEQAVRRRRHRWQRS